MASCEAACKRVGSPAPQIVRRALPACVVGDLGVVANMMSARRGGTKRQDLLDRIEQRIAVCERTGTALFSRRAVENMLATASLRSRAKAALKLKQCHQAAAAAGLLLSLPLPSARVYPVQEGHVDWAGGSLPLVQLTVQEMFARRVAGDTVRGATTATTLAEAAADELPFYDVFGAAAVSGVFAVDFGAPLAMHQVLEACVGREPPGTDWRVLLCFVASPPGDDDGAVVGGESYLAWPPSSATVRLNDRIVARRGKAALPVDVTDSVRGTAACLEVVRPRATGPLIGMKAVLIACRYDAASASGDAAHYLSRNTVPVRRFVPRGTHQDDAIEVGFYRVPLVCPLSMGRIRTPVRTATCNHAQCFDLGSHLMAGAAVGVPRWKCPICLEPAAMGKIEIDPTIQHAIASGTSADYIDLSETGAMWREVTGVAWRDPAAERARAEVAEARMCYEFWKEIDDGGTAPAASPTNSAAACGAQRASATASSPPGMGSAAMAFWLEEDGPTEPEGMAAVRSSSSSGETLCERCGRFAAGADDAAGDIFASTLCVFCRVH